MAVATRTMLSALKSPNGSHTPWPAWRSARSAAASTRCAEPGCAKPMIQIRVVAASSGDGRLGVIGHRQSRDSAYNIYVWSPLIEALL